MGYNHDSVTTESFVQEDHQKTVRQSIVKEIYESNISSDQNLSREDRFSDFDLLSMNTFHGKRAIDLAIGVLALVVFAVLYPIFGLFIKLSSKGPILYRQKRTGRKGEEFICYKFRTMHQLNLRRIDGKPVVTQKGDKRIFWFGSLLRSTNLDELPQVLNVLRGEMSLIGPRPYPIDECAHWNNTFEDFYYRYAVKPGISGLAQVKGYRGGTLDTDHMRKRLDYDLIYVEKQCLGLDLNILARTVLKMINRETDAH